MVCIILKGNNFSSGLIMQGSATPTWRQVQEIINEKTFLIQLRLVDPVKVNKRVI